MSSSVDVVETYFSMEGCTALVFKTRTLEIAGQMSVPRKMTMSYLEDICSAGSMPLYAAWTCYAEHAPLRMAHFGLLLFVLMETMESVCPHIRTIGFRASCWSELIDYDARGGTK
jgi:hypothetical protein